MNVILENNQSQNHWAKNHYTANLTCFSCLIFGSFIQKVKLPVCDKKRDTIALVGSKLLFSRVILKLISEEGADLICLLTWYFPALLIGCYAISVWGKGETKLIVSMPVFVFSCRYNCLYTEIHVKILPHFLTYFDMKSCQKSELNFRAWQKFSGQGEEKHHGN